MHVSRVLHKPPEWTHIAIEEVDTDNWGWGGHTTTAIRAGRVPVPGSRPEPGG